MILCLDIGNTHIFGGVFEQDKLLVQFRYPSTSPCTSDQLGVFLKSVLRENNINPEKITAISACSVVPSLNYSIRAAVVKYFSIEPFFLMPGVKTGLKIEYKNSHEMGADRIANAIAAQHQFPGKNIIVVDLGTATTFDVVSKEKNYIGGMITPGIHIAMKALNENTAKLPPVNIIKPEQTVGQTTITNIQSGLYYGHLGTIREIIQRITSETFKNSEVTIIGTGGFAHLFEQEKIFTIVISDLVLHGLRLVLQKNRTVSTYELTNS